MREEDREEFQRLLTDEFNFRKPKGRVLDNVLIGQYWGSLRDLPIEQVRAGFSRHRKTGRGWPMPADIRPKDARGNATAPQETLGPATDHTRGHWRSAIVFAAREKLGLRYRFDGGEILAHLMREHPNFGAALRELLDELAEQEARSGRSDGMERGCVRRAEEVARFYQHEARAEMKRRDAINHKPERTAALPLTSDTAASAQERET